MPGYIQVEVIHDQETPEKSESKLCGQILFVNEKDITDYNASEEVGL